MTEEKEKKGTAASTGYDLEEDQLGLAKYIKPVWQRTKFWMWVVLFIILAFMVYFFKVTYIDSTIPPEELIASMKVFNINSQWVEGEKVETADFKGVIIVPEFTFQVRNVGKKELSYVYILGVFRLLNRPKPLGEGFLTAFKDGLKPGEESQPITLRCKFGYRVTSKAELSQRSKDWRSAKVQIFIKSGTSGLNYFKDYFISRKIQGMDIEIKVTDLPVEEINKDMGKQKEGGQ
jgi:hypothetical protein